MKGLIVTADDFGVAFEVNDAVEQAHVHGILTGASLMVGGGAVSDAVERAQRLPTLRVGLHIVLVESRPVLPPSSIPDLVGSDGFFRRDMVASAVNMFFRPSVRRQLAAEIAAQFEAYRATGLPLDHVNTHKHFHLHPTIAGLILKVGARFGLKAARAPVEPAATLDRIEPGPGGGGATMFNLMARSVRARFRRAGVATPDQVFGLRWSGAMTTPRLRGLIETLPPGLTEIYLHPATVDRYPGSASGYRYAEELAALIASEVVLAASRPNITTGGFLDLAT